MTANPAVWKQTEMSHSTNIVFKVNLEKSLLDSCQYSRIRLLGKCCRASKSPLYLNLFSCIKRPWNILPHGSVCSSLPCIQLFHISLCCYCSRVCTKKLLYDTRKSPCSLTNTPLCECSLTHHPSQQIRLTPIDSSAVYPEPSDPCTSSKQENKTIHDSLGSLISLLLDGRLRWGLALICFRLLPSLSLPLAAKSQHSFHEAVGKGLLPLWRYTQGSNTRQRSGRQYQALDYCDIS